MLLAMGAPAARHSIDMTGARIDVDVTATEQPVMRFQSLDVHVAMPNGLSPADRAMLERAADGCPIKNSFAPDIPITVHYNYPD
jgi:putative redox protein